jgi:5'-deoxynucleotidase YfbR-like HD superfamily hydrolase
VNWILTHTGKHLDLLDPQPDQIDLTDIAHGLSHECRFSGQCRTFYSVAQHSVLVSRLVHVDIAFEALLHDATEAYLKDIPSPLKDLLPDYRIIEARLSEVIRSHFELPAHIHPAIQKADVVALITEARDLMPEEASAWASVYDVVPLAERILPLNPADAKALFNERALQLLLEHAA